MRIALVIGRYDANGGGAERWTDRHARYLLSRGHDVTLVSRTFHNPPTMARLATVSVPPRDRLGFARSAEVLLRERRFDAIHDMGDGWYADVLSPHHGTRVGGFARTSRLLPGWLRVLRNLTEPMLPRYREFSELEDRQYRGDGVRLIVALSEMIRKDMIEHFGVAEERIRVVHNGVDAEAFHSAVTDADRLARWRMRSEWGWENRCIYLLVAHNFRLKGLQELLSALALLQAVEQRVGLVVAGKGRVAEFERIARKLGVRDLVRFIGDCDDAAALYRAADVYVHPTYYDPCSLTLLEAMASGLATITTKHNGASELVCHGAEGFIISDPTDVEGLASAMETLSETPIRQRMGQLARRVATRNTLRGNSERYLDLYRFVATGYLRAA